MKKQSLHQESYVAPDALYIVIEPSTSILDPSNPSTVENPGEDPEGPIDLNG